MEKSNSKAPKEILFYGEKNPYGEFSNFYKSEFKLDDKEWPTTEHYFQAQKFKGVNEDYVEKIRLAETPGESKRLGQTRNYPLRDDWYKIISTNSRESVKYDVMKKCLIAKFSQNPSLKKLLLGTGDSKICENSPSDYIWGIGRQKTGKNLLGTALMEVRDMLKNQ